MLIVKTCNLQPITAYRPVDGIGPLTAGVPADRHHGRGAAHFHATFNFLLQLLVAHLHVEACSLQVLSFTLVVIGV